MALLERVSTLLRANINDLLNKAEDPEKLARQLVLDMENQLMQVKTQVAMAIADQHLLAKKKAEQERVQADWLRRAQMAVEKSEDEMARAALERALAAQRMAEGYAQQHADQTSEAETFRTAYTKLERKLSETQGSVELLVMQLRRSRVGQKVGAEMMLAGDEAKSKLARLKDRTAEADARGQAARTMLAIASADGLEEKFAELERNDQVEALLLELKEDRGRLTEGSELEAGTGKTLLHD